MPTQGGRNAKLKRDTRRAVRRTTYVKAVMVTPTTGQLDVLGAPFWGPYSGRDEHGEYFSPRTDFQEQVIPLPPVYYYHGAATGNLAEPIGRTTERWIDSDGVWYRVVLDMTRPEAQKCWEAAQKGELYASSGVVGSSRKVADSGEILSWLIGELSLIDLNEDEDREPANRYAIAVPHLKALRDMLPDENRRLFDNVYLDDQDRDDETLTEDDMDEIQEMLEKILNRLDALEGATEKSGCGCGGGKGRSSRKGRRKMDGESVDDVAEDVVDDVVEAVADEEDLSAAEEAVVEDAVEEAVEEILDELGLDGDEAADEVEAILDDVSSLDWDDEEAEALILSKLRKLRKAKRGAKSRSVSKSRTTKSRRTNKAGGKVAALQAEVNAMKAATRIRNDGDWLRKQIEAGRVTRAEAEQTINVLAKAAKSGNDEIASSVKAMIEARPSVATTKSANGNMSVLGYGDTSQSVDEEYQARMRRYAGIESGFGIPQSTNGKVK